MASSSKPLVWKRFIDGIFSLWDISMKREAYNLLTLQTRSTLHNQSVLVKCHLNALQSSSHWGFQRTSPFNSKNSWQLQTHFKPSETFQHAHFSSCNPLNCKKSFIKGEALRLSRTNSVRENFEKRKPHVEYSLCQKGYPLTLVQEIQTEGKFAGRKEALRNKTKQTSWEILRVGYHLQHNRATPNLKTILMKHWHIIQQQPKLIKIFNQPPIVSYS